jgi:hypothetical protein
MRGVELTSMERRDRWALIVVLAALLAWGTAFIARTSVVIDGERYFLLFDDATISMAYARNIVEGFGPVWTPGSEPVEGFTHPLWVGLMVGVNALPLPLRQRPLVVQLAGIALLALTVVRVRALLRAHFSAADHGLAGWLPAAVLTGFHYTLLYWSAFGMETALQALLAVVAVHLAFDVVYAKRDRHLALFAVFAAAYLTRMDMTLLIAVVSGWVAVHGGFRRRAVGSWLAGMALLAAAAGGYQAFRQLTYGEVLPNTYYLKVYGVPLGMRLTRGAVKAAVTLRENLLPALVVVAAVVAGLRRRSRTVLPGLLLGVYLAYSIWVGGDAWELPEINVRLNRFLAFLVPIAAVLANDLLNRGLSRARSTRWRWLVVPATVVLLLSVNGLALSSWRTANWRAALLIDRPLFVASNALVLHNLRRLELRVGPGARVVTYWAGIPAYFSRYEMVDALGYSDRTIARRPLRNGMTWREFTPGHSKSAPMYLLSRHPDAFFQFWDLSRLPVRNPKAYLAEIGYEQVGEFWIRRDSPFLLPNALDPPGPLDPPATPNG